MMGLQFRNVDSSPSDDVRTWPYEALVIAVDQGLVSDWQPIFREIRQSPWGPVARRLERYLSYREADGVGALFSLAIEHARQSADRGARSEVADRIRRSVARSGLTKADFARNVGTSASRLSTYLSGKVSPSAAMLIRIEQAGEADPVP